VFSLERDHFGRLVFISSQGERHAGCVPVRAFPLAAPDEGVSLISQEGHELVWIDRLDQLPTELRVLVTSELAQREFTPEIQRVKKVSTFSTPSVWDIDTDRGPTRLTLNGEEDIRRLPNAGLLIADHQGVQFKVTNLRELDRQSRRLLERFL
jgi:hypothetical protein